MFSSLQVSWPKFHMHFSSLPWMLHAPPHNVLKLQDLISEAHNPRRDNYQVFNIKTFFQKLKIWVFHQLEEEEKQVHLQPSLPALLTVTGVISNAINTGGIVPAFILLTLIDVCSTVITLKACTAVANIWFCWGSTMSTIKAFILEAQLTASFQTICPLPRCRQFKWDLCSGVVRIQLVRSEVWKQKTSNSNFT